MDQRITCRKCGHEGLYDKGQIENMGTFFRPLLQILCEKCGHALMTIPSSNNPFPKNKDILLEMDPETGGIMVTNKKVKRSEVPKKSATEKALSAETREWPIQLYVEKFYRELGFTSIKGPFTSGPDFTTWHEKQKVGIEVERNWENYLKHQHHKNPKFAHVKFLVVLQPGDPPESKRSLLPDEIIYIDVKKFVRWQGAQAQEYTKNKNAYDEQMQLTLRIEWIAQHLVERYVRVCPDKEREMAICPSCTMCAYMPELDFGALALEHIVLEGYQIWDDEFSLSEIDPKKLNKFFEKRIVS